MSTEENKSGQACVIMTSAIAVSALIFRSQFVIGTKKIDLGFATISILPILFAVMFGMALSVNWTKSKIKAWGKVFTEKEEGFCGKMVNAAEDRKGAMFSLGSVNTEAGICNYLHSNPYYVDDDFLLVGAQIFIHIACH